MIRLGTCGNCQIDWFIFLTVLLESLCRGRCGENGSGETGKVSEWSKMLLIIFFFKILFFYFSREGKGGRKTGRETSMCGCLSSARPTWRPGLKPRHVP